MKFSIIIPVYNAECTLKRCIESLISQSHKDIEIILINDHSEDNSADICTEYSLKYSNIIFENSGNKGVSNARNTGLKIASGDIIGFCDSDDYYCDNVIDILNKIFSEDKSIDLICTGFNRIKKKDIFPVSFSKSKIYTMKLFAKCVMYDDRSMGSVWNKFFKRVLLNGIYFDPVLSYCEDMHFLINVASNNLRSKVMISNLVTYNYVFNSSSVTNNADKLFDFNGRLNYIVSLEAILNNFSIDFGFRILVKNKMFFLASDVLKSFKLNEQRKKYIDTILKKNFFSFAVMIFRFPQKNIRRLLSIIKMKLLK